MRFHAVIGEDAAPALVHNHEACADSLCTRIDELYLHGFPDLESLGRVSDLLVRHHRISYGPSEEMPLPPPGYRFLTRTERLLADSGLNNAVSKYGFPLEKYL